MNEIAVLSWFYIPTAFLLGLLHGLEPGHSKTMMAAFIVATRGTIGQAIVLALAATVSHTAIVWIVALGGLAYGDRWLGVADEPWLELVSALLVIGVGLWMLLSRLHEHHNHHHGHSHEDAHTHAHAQDIAALQEGKPVTMGQVVMFGLTGGLVPCAAAITVLLLCLQTHRIVLGAVLVLSFSLGLAVTLMGSAVAAAWGMRHIGRHLPRLDGLIRRAPYAASGITLAIGVYLAVAALARLG
jgi:nickel/cobalt exporter